MQLNLARVMIYGYQCIVYAYMLTDLCCNRILECVMPVWSPIIVYAYVVTDLWGNRILELVMIFGHQYMHTW